MDLSLGLSENDTHLHNSANQSNATGPKGIPAWCRNGWFGLNYSLVLLVLICNSAILYVVYKNRNLHTTAYAFVCNLAVCDMCYGLGIAFFTATVYFPEMANNFTLCRFAIIAFYSSIGFATVGIALISVERCVAIKCAIHYNRMLTRGRVAVAIAASPAFFVALAVGIVFPWSNEPGAGCVTTVVLPNWAVILASGCVLATQVASTACYMIVYLVARKQRNRISQELDYLSRLATPAAAPPACGNGATEAWRRRRSWRLTVTVGIVLLVFYAFWGPSWIIQLLRISHPDSEITLTLAYFSSSYSTVNSVVNIFIYGFKTKEFREAARRTLLAPLFGGLCRAAHGGRRDVSCTQVTLGKIELSTVLALSHS